VIKWPIRLFLLVAGYLAGFLVARDAPNFGLVQVMIAFLLVVLTVYALAFWPPLSIVDRLRGFLQTKLPPNQP
jgi:hypothetical protein